MSDSDQQGAGARLDRRAALARLGLAATAAYAAPLLTALSGARASSRGKGSHDHHRGSGCGSSGHCGSGRRRARRVRVYDDVYYSPYPPPPPPRPGLHIVLPQVEVIIRP